MFQMRNKTEVWDLEAKYGLFWDLFSTLVPFWTKSQIRDLIGAPALSKCAKRPNSPPLFFEPFPYQLIVIIIGGHPVNIQARMADKTFIFPRDVGYKAPPLQNN